MNNLHDSERTRSQIHDNEIRESLDVARELSSFAGGERYLLDCPLKPTVILGMGPAGTASVLYLKHLFTSYTTYMASPFISTLGIIFRCVSEQEYLDASCGTAWLEADEKLILESQELDSETEKQLVEFIADAVRKCSLRQFWGEKEKRSVRLILLEDERRRHQFVRVHHFLREISGRRCNKNDFECGWEYTFYPVKCDATEIRRWGRVVFSKIALSTNMDWNDFPWFEVRSLLCRELFIRLDGVLDRRPTASEVNRMLEEDGMLADQIWESDVWKETDEVDDIFAIAENMTIDLIENVVKPRLIKYGPGFVAEYLWSENAESEKCLVNHIDRVRLWLAKLDVLDEDDDKKAKVLDSALYAFQKRIMNMALVLRRMDFCLRTFSDFFMDALEFVSTAEDVTWQVDPYLWMKERRAAIEELLGSGDLPGRFLAEIIKDIYVWSGSDFSDAHYKLPICKGIDEIGDSFVNCLEQVFGDILKEAL